MKRYTKTIYIVLTTSMLAAFWIHTDIGALPATLTPAGLEMVKIQSERSEIDENKKVVRHYVEKFNAGDLGGMKTIFAEDALIYGVLGWGKVADVMPIWKQLVDALAMRLDIEDMIAEGDIVAVRYKESGTAKAPFFGKPATGKSYELVAMEWFIVKDGKIQGRWGARDAASQARQLGWDVPAVKTDVENKAGQSH